MAVTSFYVVLLSFVVGIKHFDVISQVEFCI